MYLFTVFAIIGACLFPDADTRITPSIPLIFFNLSSKLLSEAKIAPMSSNYILPVASALPEPTTNGFLYGIIISGISLS